MSKFLKVRVAKTFFTDVFIVVPDGFDGNLARYSGAIRTQANNASPSRFDMGPWKEDVEAFEFDLTLREASQDEVEDLDLNGLPEDVPDY